METESDTWKQKHIEVQKRDFSLMMEIYENTLVFFLGELRLGRVSGELTSGECDEIDGNAADDKRR
ncbi:hypothetical protein YC2023_014877 [Brassica napus]